MSQDCHAKVAVNVQKRMDYCNLGYFEITWDQLQLVPDQNGKYHDKKNTDE
jgi:hypothetical protein